MAHTIRRRRTLAALALSPLALLGAESSAQAGAGPGPRGIPGIPGIPQGYAGVDPRTARRVPLWQPLNPDVPIFPGDPLLSYETFTTIEESGYLLEQITSLGTHTGTHISAPAHFIEGGKFLDEIGERFALMPLVVIDVAKRVARQGGDFSLEIEDLKAWERRHGRIPADAAVLLYSGFSTLYSASAAAAASFQTSKLKAAAAAGRSSGTSTPKTAAPVSYFDPAPGFTGDAVAWLFDKRHIFGVGSDTFGPDATSDVDFAATFTALDKGGITVENVGPRLKDMRPHGDWVAINGGRPHFSGFQMGITGFTRRR